jgi:hypothetical protein
MEIRMVTPTEDYYPDHDGGQFAPILATVATWRAPAFLENLAIDAEGANNARTRNEENVKASEGPCGLFLRHFKNKESRP